MKFVSIDIETTGLDPEKDQILQIGMVVGDFTTPITDLPRWECYIKHTEIKGQPYALSMNGQILADIANPKPGQIHLNPLHVGTSMYQWLKEFGKDLDPKWQDYKPLKFTAAGKNFAGFDLQFLKKLWCFDWLQPHHRVLDPGTLFFNPAYDTEIPNMQECMRRAGIEGEVGHTAVEDALMVARLLRWAYENILPRDIVL